MDQASKLWISKPGSSSYQFYHEKAESDIHFHFVSFDGLRSLKVPLEAALERGGETFYTKKDKELPQALSEIDYLKLLQRAIEEIENKALAKIVCSRAAIKSGSLDPLAMFHRLRERYPTACVYLFSHPASGTWLGATPETLLRKAGDQLFTMSLAGTRLQAEAGGFTAKEKHEQQLVTDYICEIFKNDRGTEALEVDEATTVTAGHLQHLRSSIRARCRPDFEQAALLAKLHPTPAVAGMPLLPALQFLRREEAYDRSFYSGYLGLQQGDDFHFFVNLRCMQVFEHAMVFYAGGGITRQSDPASEWQETEAKLNTLRSVLED